MSELWSLYRGGHGKYARSNRSMFGTGRYMYKWSKIFRMERNRGCGSMTRLPNITFNKLIRLVEKQGFERIRQKGSHIRFIHSDGRCTTIPDHGSKDVPKGLLFKIVRYDRDLKPFLKEQASIQQQRRINPNRMVFEFDRVNIGAFATGTHGIMTQ